MGQMKFSKFLNSKWIVLLIALFIIIARFSKVTDKEVSWDILGYYSYLPATFIHNDPMLTDVSWLQTEMEERELSQTMYFISQNKDGEPVYFFLMGMALFYLPWFLIGHGMAHLLDFPPDGFSAPYIYALIVGAVSYTILGLYFLRKVLLHFFTDNITSWVLIIIYLGTNTVHHLIAKDLETVNVLFMLGAFVFLKTIQWHSHHKKSDLIAIGIGIGLMILVKPSEILIGLLPLFYGVYNWKSAKDKWALIVKHKWNFILTIAIGLLVLSPQLIYWKVTTGQFVYDSYSNPGVGLDWWQPYFMEVLFSYKKGWLLYTPVMSLGLLGFYFLYKHHRKVFLGLLLYFSVSFFLLSSWTEWWYGSSFSCRPVITLYPVLAITIGYLLYHFYRTNKTVYKLVLGISVMFIALNQFQWWQFKNYILDDYCMTKEYYWKSFLKTSVTLEDKKLMAPMPDFSGSGDVGDPEDYLSTQLWELNLISPKDWVKKEKIESDSTGVFFRLSKEDQWELAFKTPLDQVTDAEYFYIEYDIVYRFPIELPKGDFPCLVNSVERSNGHYGYNACALHTDVKGEWVSQSCRYVAPRVREYEDLLNFNIWNRSLSQLEIRSISARLYELQK